jgi:hypothetical protein
MEVKMAKFDWKAVIGSVAPVLGTALGGPLGGMAASVAGRILLGKDSATPSEITDFISANQSPETFLKLKEVEAQLKLELKKIGLEHAKLEVASEEISMKDRDSARNREAVVKDRTNQVLAIAVMGGFLAMSWGVLFGEIGIESALAGTIVGYMSAKAEQVLSYYFGSSAGSKLKTMLMDDHKEKDGGNK